VTKPSNPPTPASGDSEPGPAPSLPPHLPADAGLWDDADMHALRGPAASFSDAPRGPGDEPAPSIGHIGRYGLKYLLGEGGIGTVYAAHDPLLSRLIAVKTLHVEVQDSERESFNALFLNEARAAAGLSHPHIVTVFDAGVSDKRAYIAMELLKGRDLRQLRQEGWRATPPQAATIARRVADALGYAHSKGVVHRDIKPANIFMVGRTQPKVLDFGIAHIAHRQDGLSVFGDVAAGSPYYMAPEQVRQESVDRRADVFSLGVVLYELLTNAKPFQGTTLDEITSAVLKHEPPLASVVDPAVPPALAEIAAKAMAKNPDDRYRSARALARDLRHWLDENTTAADADLPSPAPAGLKVWWLAAGVGALAVAGLVWNTVAPTAAVATAAAAAPAPASAPSSAPALTPAAAPAVATVAAAASAVAAPAAVAMTASAAAPSPAAPLPAPAAAASAPIITSGPAQRPVLMAAATETPAEATTAAPPAAGRAGPVVAKAALATPAALAVQAVPKPPKEASKETPKEKRAREARERDAKAAALAASAAAPAPNGVVRIAVSPWGEVEVDGKTAGTSPPLTELSLSPGRHQIVIRNSDQPPHSVVVNVTADQPVTLKHKF
jgi:eukaryotic-like serine/threonine-protein kinase